MYGPCEPYVDLSAAWPQAYVDYLPCGACTKLDESDEAKRKKNKRRRKNWAKQERFIVDTSPRSTSTISLRWSFISLSKTPLSTMMRFVLRQLQSKLVLTSKSVLLLPEFASEVYGFLDRAYVGTSLLANRALNKLLFKLRHLLPVHHLMCEFEPHLEEGHSSARRVRGEYWITVRHFRRELPHSDSRRFKVPSEAGPAVYCSLVRRHLSHSHLSDFKTPESDFRFSVKMLADLVDRNYSVGTLRMGADGGGLKDYRSMDAVFNGGMRLATLELSLLEHELATLVKTADFFRMPTVQKLTALKLELATPRKKSVMPRRSAIVPHSLWIAGIQLLRNSERLEVKYESARHLRTIGHMIVQLCEEFERGGISELVQHFMFATSHHVAFPFKEANKIASKVKLDDYDWDVYRFRNAASGEWLTACVGRGRSEYYHR